NLEERLRTDLQLAECTCQSAEARSLPAEAWLWPLADPPCDEGSPRRRESSAAIDTQVDRTARAAVCCSCPLQRLRNDRYKSLSPLPCPQGSRRTPARRGPKRSCLSQGRQRRVPPGDVGREGEDFVSRRSNDTCRKSNRRRSQPLVRSQPSTSRVVTKDEVRFRVARQPSPGTDLFLELGGAPTGVTSESQQGTGSRLTVG